MPVIITIIIAIFLILISWTWHNLGKIDKIKKIITIIISLIIMYIVTLVIFNISKADLNYSTNEGMNAVKNILVLLFTIINGIIVMPYMSKILNKIYENEIEYKEAKKNLIIIFIVFFILIFFECGYLKDIQQGILDIYNTASNK